MPHNSGDYSEYLRRQVEAMRAEYMRRAGVFAAKVLEVAINNSPVDTGRLRQGWHLTVGAPSSAESGGDKSALNEAQGAAAKATLGDVFWIQNNVPYAHVIEFGLYVPKDPGPTKWGHIRNRRVRDHLRKGDPVTLVRGGFHVSAPEGMLADAVQQVVSAAESGVLWET